jgi:cytochrome oxidase Cu insertion factor (SCO1/SenC/PrrC family)
VQTDLPRTVSASTTMAPIDRAAALAEGAPKVPRRVIVIAVLVAATLALGGALLERVASGTGLNPSSTGTTTTTIPQTIAELHASTASLLGITGLAPTPAAGFRLTDQAGRAVSLRSLRGEVVVLTFFNANCADACPIIAGEIRRANADLGARRGHVVFVTVNTDPLATGSAPAPRAVTSTGLANLANWKYLTGPLRTLDPIWRRYGVAIDVYTKTGRVAHNDVMYFIDRTGRLRIRATPVANESSTGAFSLPGVLVARSAAGIATYANQLLGQRR